MPRIGRKGVEEARNQLPKLIEAAERGQPTLITRRGRAVAVLAPLESHRPQAQQSLLSLAGSGRGLWGRNSTRAIDALRGEWSR
jgi:prevent-host-death family protein